MFGCKMMQCGFLRQKSMLLLAPSKRKTILLCELSMLLCDEEGLLQWKQRVQAEDGGALDVQERSQKNGLLLAVLGTQMHLDLLGTFNVAMRKLSITSDRLKSSNSPLARASPAATNREFMRSKQQDDMMQSAGRSSHTTRGRKTSTDKVSLTSELVRATQRMLLM